MKTPAYTTQTSPETHQLPPLIRKVMDAASILT